MPSKMANGLRVTSPLSDEERTAEYGLVIEVAQVLLAACTYAVDCLPVAGQVLGQQRRLLLLLLLALVVQSQHKKQSVQKQQTAVLAAAAALAAALERCCSLEHPASCPPHEQQPQKQRLAATWHEQLLLSLGVPAAELDTLAAAFQPAEELDTVAAAAAQPAAKPHAASRLSQVPCSTILKGLMASSNEAPGCYQWSPMQPGYPSGLATSSWEFRPAGGRALANFDQLPTRGSVWRGKCILAGDLVETPPVSGPKFRSAGRRPFQNFRKQGPSAPEFRPVDEAASPGTHGAAAAVTRFCSCRWWARCWSCCCCSATVRAWLAQQKVLPPIRWPCAARRQ
jgi:hypothetical protein